MGSVARRTTTLRFALLVMGFSGTAFQILVIRELLVTFHGNELSIGIILGIWLILEAVGTFYARKKADIAKRYASSFAILQVLIGFFSILSILFIRSFKYFFGISQGELLGIHYVAFISLVALLPVTVLDGALFPYGCRNISTVFRSEGAAARVYIYESIGAFFAGILFVIYFIYFFTTVELAAIVFSLNLFSAFLYLTSIGESRFLRLSLILLLSLTITSFVVSTQRWLHLMSSKLLWYEHHLLGTKNSVYSNIAVTKDEDEYTFFVNGSPYTVTPAPHVEELAHLPMLFHKGAEHILLIGGGAGGLLNELLKYPVKMIDYTEQDPLLIETFQRFPTPLTEYELRHEKVKIHLLEGRLFLRKTKNKYDLIIINLPIPSTLQLNRYYTVEFFECAKKHLRKDGILSLKLPGSETFLPEEMKELNRTIYASLRQVFPHVRVIVGDQNIFLASEDESINIAKDKLLIERLYARRIEATLINEWYIRYKLDTKRFGQLEREIISSSREDLNRDTNPKGVFESMVFLNLITSPYMVKALKIVDDIPLHFYLATIAVFTLALLIIQQRHSRELFISFAVTSTGFTSMLMSILLILAFQIYYGYVYHYIGLLTSVFMVGLACGAFIAMKKGNIHLISIEGQLLLLALIVYLFFLLKPDPVLSQFMIFILMFYSGLLTGVEYPVAVKLSGSHGAVSSVAGRIYALDLVGSFFGAILTAVVLIPVMGIMDTLVLVMTIKAASIFLTYMGRLK